MEIDEKRRKYLIKKYRVPTFERKRQDIIMINKLISDEDLIDIIKINNEDMERIIYSGNINQEELIKLVYANVNFYNIASYRKISVDGRNTMVFASTFIDIKPHCDLPLFVMDRNDDGKKAHRRK